MGRHRQDGEKKTRNSKHKVESHFLILAGWVWLTASLKFLVPFSVLVSLGGHVHWRTAPQVIQSKFSVVIDEVGEPFTAPAASSVPLTAPLPANIIFPALLWTIWACGFLGITSSWWIRWRQIRAVVLAGSPLPLDFSIRAVSSPTLLEPGVFGVFRPVMLLPEGILDGLTTAQLEGVIAHELCHVYYHDNLIAAAHMFCGNGLLVPPPGVVDRKANGRAARTRL